MQIPSSKNDALVLVAPLLLSGVWVGLLSPPAVMADSPDAPAEELLFSLSDSDARSILDNLGLADVRVDSKDADRTTFAFTVDGVDVFLRSYHATQDMRIYIHYASRIESEQEKMDLANRWNCQQQGIKAYIDSQGNWVIESDMIVGPGVTKEAITTFIQRFLTHRTRFEEHIQ